MTFLWSGLVWSSLVWQDQFGKFTWTSPRTGIQYQRKLDPLLSHLTQQINLFSNIWQFNNIQTKYFISTTIQCSRQWHILLVLLALKLGLELSNEICLQIYGQQGFSGISDMVTINLHPDIKNIRSTWYVFRVWNFKKYKVASTLQFV